MSAEPLSIPTLRPAGPKFLTRPASEDPKDLGFERRPMVDWLAPAQLARTGIKAVLSGVFGAYADKREVMAALDPSPQLQDLYSRKDEIWIDYVADLGDGFDATYTLATLLAAPTLTLGGRETPRGEILVMGGDQVYPTASYEEYHNRLIMPYRAALPCAAEGEPPHLYAVPGNHDWYDGLSNFTRIFCQGGWIGGWKTKQKRSYFALKLPHNWWLWGIDIQLEGFIDSSQLDYFKGIRLEPEDKIILCTAEPAWVYAVTKGPEAFRSLAYFEDRVIREKDGGVMRVALTGDLHHYTRYESADGRTQRITAGGGGAYLYATHESPEALSLAEGREQVGSEVKDRTVDYTLKQTFPSRERSKALSFGSLRLPWRSWRFGAFLASFYGLFTWIIQSASLTLPGLSFLETVREDSLGETFQKFAGIAARSPSVAFLTLLMVGGMIAFCAAPKTGLRVLLGAAHGLGHIALTVLLLFSFARINPHLPWLRDFHPGSLPYLGTSVLEMLLVGGFLGGFLMAIYLMLCSSLGGFHTNEVFSSQRMADYKNFLRLHIDRTGKLTLYPVGIPDVCKGKDWRFQKDGALSDPWWKPKQPIRAELIEKPVEVS
ncbi:MAG TPA: metallophosphoesterase [Thermoanaerobaculia bacterium]|jgi:hypothetical protein|nr:metallophosphoesterase [Thermoanaerobaculia bacterium]